MRIRLLLGLLMLSVGLSVQAADDYSAPRERYRLAKAALKTGDRGLYDTLAVTLKDYPLYPYLVLADLRTRLDTASDADLEAFLHTYEDTLVAADLRGAWLRHLMHEGRWQKFLTVYDGRSSTALACYHLRARIRAHRLTGVAEEALKLWLVGHSQDSACDPLFIWLQAQGRLTPEVIWQRIERAMSQGNIDLAAYLGRKLPIKEREWVELWRKAHTKPAATLDNPALKTDTTLTRRIVRHAVTRLIEQDLTQAKLTWDKLITRFSFTQDERGGIERQLALRAAWRHHPSAALWLSQLPQEAIDQQAQLWRIRTALRAGDWPLLKREIERLDDAQQAENAWRYWYARALDKTGDPEHAKALFRKLAQTRDYYGFLAADRLDQPYALSHDPIALDPKVQQALRERPAILRAQEFYQLNELMPAAREWHDALRGLGPDQLKQAAALAHKWSWHSAAIETLGKAQAYDDLTVRFPTPFHAPVMTSARTHALEPAWLYAILRQESAFRPDARSAAGALGLMQLLPTTAAATARKQGKATPSTQALLTAEVNIPLGSAYLNELYQRFTHNPVLATAAYNAGPHRVERWLPKQGQMEADQWIDSIPFTETRRYVQTVFTYTMIYAAQLDHNTLRLSGHMLQIKSASS